MKFTFKRLYICLRTCIYVYTKDTEVAQELVEDLDTQGWEEAVRSAAAPLNCGTAFSATQLCHPSGTVSLGPTFQSPKRRAHCLRLAVFTLPRFWC